MRKRPRRKAVVDFDKADEIDDDGCDSDIIFVGQTIKRQVIGARPVTDQRAQVGEDRLFGPLAVHSKKVAEVAQWFENIAGSGRRRLLLLSGPPGVGKSSCLRAVVAKKAMTLMEWFHGPDQSSMLQTVQAMRTFLSEAQAPSLTAPTPRDKKVLLIDDFPAVTFGSPAELELRKLWEDCGLATGCLAVVWITSDERRLLRQNMDTDTVTFRPVANTMMRKVLEAASDIWSTKKVSRDVLEAISASSNGDIRAALLSLQLHCTQRSFVTKDGHRINTKTPLAGVGKDVPLEAVRGVSKVLHGKRKEKNEQKFKDEPEDILAASMIEATNMLSFLFQNYLEFFGDIDDVATSSEYMSDGDLMCVWRQDQLTYRDISECGCASVASRALMACNLQRTPNSFRPIKGPEMRQVEILAAENTNRARYQTGPFPDLRRKAAIEYSCLSRNAPMVQSGDQCLLPMELESDMIADWDD